VTGPDSISKQRPRRSKREILLASKDEKYG
jgi:hypothetical protein